MSIQSGQLRYFFNTITACNMCGDKSNDHKVLGQRMNRSQGLRPKRKAAITTSVLQCCNCGLIYSNPQPVPFDIQDHYGVPPEEYWQPSYFNYDPAYFSAEIRTAKKI